MNLAILVVYMVTPENGRLIDLHLEHISKYTEGDYTIYASINGLLPQFHSKLSEHPRVKICSFPTTEETESEEHSYYLEKLTAIAIDDGATHLVTMHVDSFPIANGWDSYIFRQLSKDCVLAATCKNGVPVKPSACLFFTREFYLNYKPAFLLSPTDLNSEPCQRFQKRYSIVSWDSGMGFFLKAYIEGLRWHALERMDKQGGSAIYGDLIFHLEKAYVTGSVTKSELSPTKKAIRGLLNSLKYTILPLIPASHLYDRHGLIRKIMLKINRKLIVDSIYAEEREQLLEQTDLFISRLKTDRKENSC